MTGRALPDITGWMGCVEIGTQAMANAKIIKNGDVDKVISNNAPIVFGYDSKGKPYYSNTLPDGASFTFYIQVDTSTAGEKVIEFDVWSRLDNKNWRERLICACGDKAIVVNVIEKSVEYDVDADNKGNLVIPHALLGTVLPQTNGQDWLKIWLDEQEIFGNGNIPAGNPDWTKSGYQTDKNNILVRNSALAASGADVVAIYVYSIPQNEWFEFWLELVYDGSGKLLGANFLWSDFDEEDEE